MRTLNLNELNEVDGGRLTVANAISLGGLFSDIFNLVEAAMRVDYASMVSSSTADFASVNPMGDYTNGMCSR